MGEASLTDLKSALSGNTSKDVRKGGDFLSAKLPAEAKTTLDRIVSEWVVDEDQALNAASTAGFQRMISTATNNLYDGCCDKTVKQHITAMAKEGRVECAEFHKALQVSGIKPTASGDLWSKNGTALFGLVSHGIRRSIETQPDGSSKAKWTMREKLAGAVPCNADRHTGDHISELSDQAWKETGITKPVEQLFARVSDNGANMIKGWRDGFQIPCSDHTMELSVHQFTNDPDIAATLSKGRGQVGYFNMSNIGYTEKGVGLHACQKSAGVPENRLTQDVKTRWRSAHAMANTLRINSEAMLLYDIRNPDAAKGFKENRYSLEDWHINNQSVAVLAALATASQYLEGKNYPTSNLVLPSMYGCIELMRPDAPVRQPWDNKLLQVSQLRPEVSSARKKLHADLALRWKTDLPEPVKRFYFIATVCDPRQKNLRFPGIDHGARAVGHIWFQSEFDSIWAPAPAPATPRTDPGPDPTAEGTSSGHSHPQYQGASFQNFMAGLAHLPGGGGGESKTSPQKRRRCLRQQHTLSYQKCPWTQTYWSGGLHTKKSFPT